MGGGVGVGVVGKYPITVGRSPDVFTSLNLNMWKILKSGVMVTEPFKRQNAESASGGGVKSQKQAEVMNHKAVTSEHELNEDGSFKKKVLKCC